LRHVERGFYVDIGAQDPSVDSVSRGFYEQGWRGVHVEPSESSAQKLRAARPDEEVIQAAIGSDADSLNFYEIPET
ncbi:FkbM family methyltransferase, partial [Klebsiella pneumoniae]